MAVEFKTFETAAPTITIGGTITAGTDNIISGPFPRYSISKEVIIKDTVYIGEKYTITVTGTALITGSGVNMLTPGARQNALHAVIEDLIKIRGQRGNVIIEPYDGGTNTNKLQFNDAALTNVEIPEQTDTSQGTQSQEYTFTFESTDYNGYLPSEGPDYSNLQDITETWEFGLLDGESTQLEWETYPAEGSTDKIFRNFSVTHTLSAKGSPCSDTTNPGRISAGYVAAKNFVLNRLNAIGNSPFGADVKDFGQGAPITPEFKGQQKIFLTPETGEGAQPNPPNAPTSYNAYNQVNTYTQDILEGTYSVTRNWVASRYKATVTMEVVNNTDRTAEFNTTEISINFQGHETAGPDDVNSRKYQNAYDLYNSNSWSRPPGATGTLRSTSITHSQTAGTINISETYSDEDVLIAGSISSSITVTDSNQSGGNQAVAILPVIQRAGGPIIQDMGTSTERTRTLAVEATMARGEGEPSFDASGYAPSDSYQRSYVKSWSEGPRRYSLTIEWVYTG
jgi:hypothetical protein